MRRPNGEMTPLRLRANSWIVLLVFSVLGVSAATPTQIAIADVTIIDVHDGSAKRGMTVLISGNRIIAVGSSKETPIPKQMRVIDGRGRFLIPGLWDMHVHSDGGEDALRMMVDWGITGARDMGGDPRKLVEAREHIANQDWTGPRLLIAGPRLMGPPTEPDEDVWILHSPEEARRAVDSLIRQHVNFIKVHDDLARDTYLAIASAAKENGLPFVGHVPSSVTPAEASDLGQKSIEHLEFVPKPCLVLFHSRGRADVSVPPGCDTESIGALMQRFTQNGTWLDPTIQSFKYWAPAEWDAIFAGFKKTTVQIRRAKVCTLTGTDWSTSLQAKGSLPGPSLHDEMALLADAGFSSTEVLRAATLNPALFLRLSDSLGTVERGMIANLVLLERNPIEDIHNTRRIALVLLEGRIVVDRSAR
jgi:imidazolonepropionase-like amidohydrolase